MLDDLGHAQFVAKREGHRSVRLTPMRLVWGLLALVIAVAGLVTVKPELFDVTAEYALRAPFAQVLAMRGWLVVGFAAAGLFFLIVAAIRRAAVGRGRIAFTLSLAMFLVAGLHGGTMYSRGVEQSDSLSTDTGFATGTLGDGSITVLQYNTLGGSVDVDALADVIEANGVDVITMPETSTETAEDLVVTLAERGKGFQQFDTGTSGYDADYRSTALLVSLSLGEYTQTDLFEPTNEPTQLGVRAVPVNGEGPTLLAVHPVAPSSARLSMWREEISKVYSMCATEPNAIISGDFNSTADHEAALRLGATCNDTVAQAGSGAVGTWTVKLPALLGSPIDRVLTTAAFEGSEAAVIDLGGSDHRGILVRLEPSA